MKIENYMQITCKMCGHLIEYTDKIYYCSFCGRKIAFNINTMNKDFKIKKSNA